MTKNLIKDRLLKNQTTPKTLTETVEEVCNKKLSRPWLT